MIKNNLESIVFKKILDDNITLNAFCDSCDIRVIDFFSISDGKYIPRLETVLKFAKALDVPVEKLFVLVEEKDDTEGERIKEGWQKVLESNGLKR